MAISGDKIVTSDENHVIRVFSVSTCLLMLPFMGFFMMSYGAVEMIKQFPDDVDCSSLSFHGDVVYIGSWRCVIQWNVVTNTIVRLEGHPGLI